MNTTMVRRAGVTPISTVEQGAEAILNLAASPALAGRSGLYFNGLRETRAHAQADDTEARRRLRRLSLELTGRLIGWPRRDRPGVERRGGHLVRVDRQGVETSVLSVLGTFCWIEAQPPEASGPVCRRVTKRSPNPGRFGAFVATDIAAAAELERSLAPLR